MASPIAWEHHYGVAAIGFILALPSVIAGGSAARGALFAASFVFAANFLPAFNAFAGTALNLLQSYLFFAALGLAYVLITAPPWGAGAKTEAGAPAAAAP